jgi:hypothetical protein
VISGKKGRKFLSNLKEKEDRKKIYGKLKLKGQNGLKSA